MTDVPNTSDQPDFYRGKSFDADPAFVKARAKLLSAFDAGQCFMKLYYTSAGCWCIGAAPGGGNLTCPTDEKPKPSTTLPTKEDRYHSITDQMPKPFFPKK